MIATLIALPYEAARFPFTVLDRQLAGRLPETSGPRVVLDRAFGRADQVAGLVLHNAAIAQRGSDRLEHTSKLLEAVRLEAQAATLRQRAQQTEKAAAERAEEKRRAAVETAESGLEEADAVEADKTRKASEQARARAAAKKSEADAKAAREESAAQQRRRRTEATAEKKKQAAQSKAKAELDEAREAKQSAADKRSDAERLSDLTDAKREDRTS